MKTLTKLITAVALSSITMGAYANGYSDNYSKDRHHHFKGDHFEYKKSHYKCSKNHKISPMERQLKMQARIDRKVARMTDKYDLNKKQQRKLKRVLAQQYEKKRELYRESRQQIKGILNKQQKQMMKHEHKHHHAGFKIIYQNHS